MINFLAICSLLALCLEVGLQLCVLFSSTHTDNLDCPLLAVITSLLVFSVLVTNLSSLVLALRTDPVDFRGREKGACVLLHCLQLGLGWRVYRVLVRYNKTAWLHLTSLRLIHVSLTSFLYFILQGRVMFFPERALKPLAVLSLMASLWSCSVALCSYTLRHKLHEAMVLQEAVTLKTSAPRRYTGLAMVLAGTFLCLLARLAAFTLLSAEHAFWVFLPFCLHFCIQAAAYLACSRRSANSSPANQSGSESNMSSNHPTHLTTASANGFSSTATPETSTASPGLSFQPPGMAWYLLRGVARCYLYTWDLVEGEVGRLRCGYVLFYTLVLVENLAMTAAWLLHSALDYTVKLVVLVALLATFLAALLLKFASCGCAVGDVDSDHALYSQDSPRAFTALQDQGTNNGDCGESVSWRGMAGNHTRATLHRAGGKDFFASIPRDRTNTCMSFATVSSLTSADGRRLGKTRGDHTQKRRWSHPDNAHALTIGLSDSVLLEALKEQRKMYAERHGQHRHETHNHSQLTSMDNSLVTEGQQCHLHDLIGHRYGSSETLWTTSLGTLAEHPDGCFDDPILASRLVLDSLEQSRPESQHSSSKSRHRHSDRGSNDGRFYQRDTNKPTSKFQLLLANRRTAPGPEVFQDSKPPRTWRNKIACDSYELKRAGDEYRYMTRCSCRGSPSSTPRRRPGHQFHTRKTHSYGSNHHSHHHIHQRSKVVPKTDSGHRSDTKQANRPRGPGSVSQKGPEKSKWAESMSSRTPRKPSRPARLQSAVDSQSSITSTSTSTEGSPSCPSRHRHHHDNNSSERAATWPRRQSRKRTRRMPTTRPALTQDGVCTQHVVHLWLQGLESPEGYPQDPGNIRYPQDPSIHDGATKRTISDTQSARAYAVQCDCSDCSSSVVMDDDGEDDSDDSVPREKSKCRLHDLPHPNQRTQNFDRYQHGETTLSDSWCVDERSFRNRQFRQTETKDCRPVVKRKCLNTTEPPLTCGGQQTALASSPQRNIRSPGFQNYVVPSSTHPRHLYLHDLNTVLTDTSSSNSSRSKVKSRHQATFLSSVAQHRPLHTSVPDSGVSLSTVQDSDGSRSNVQGHKHSKPQGHGFGPRSSDLELSRQPPSDLSKGSQQNHQIPQSRLQWDGENKCSGDPHSYTVSDEETREPLKVTLDMDESLV